MSKKVYIFVGLPASGKSTYLDRIFEEGMFVYSTDQYLEKKAAKKGKTYEDVFSDYIDKATKQANKDLAVAIENGLDIIWDQTNLGKNKRQRLIQRFKQHGYVIVCIYFPIYVQDHAEWVDRLYSREGKTISNDVILSMIDHMDVPDISEGFSEIRYIHTFGKDYCQEILDRETTST